MQPQSTTSVTYQEALGVVQNLPPNEALRLATEILMRLQNEVDPTSSVPKTRKLSELRGLGKELWQKVDVESYIQQERSAWDG